MRKLCRFPGAAAVLAISDYILRPDLQGRVNLDKLYEWFSKYMSYAIDSALAEKWQTFNTPWMPCAKQVLKEATRELRLRVRLRVRFLGHLNSLFNLRLRISRRVLAA
jgi:hypothetical protein